jgi:phospho-N-acetylmuramoyl-pentapeptide-transferase
MLYYLFIWLHDAIDFPGAGVFQYISFRAALALITSLFISMIIGKRLIGFLRKRQVGETIRDLGLEGQQAKQGTPTMGGLIILAAILIPTLLLAKLHNIYVLLILITTIWLGTIGFLDDYIKVFRKDKKGLAGKFKVMGQIGLGLIIGTTMFFSKDIVIREKNSRQAVVTASEILNVEGSADRAKIATNPPTKSTKTTIPFLKNNEFDYSVLIAWIGSGYKKWTFLVFIHLHHHCGVERSKPD